jgi:hypothetical protein
LTAGWEFDDLMRRMTLSIAFVAVALLGAAALYVHRLAPPTCGSELALDRISRILRDDFHLDSIIANNVRTVSGGFFSDSHDCSAEIAEVRGDVDASVMPWREIRYRIVHQDKPPSFGITVELGDRVPLEPQNPSLWQRLLAHL